MTNQTDLESLQTKSSGEMVKTSLKAISTWFRQNVLLVLTFSGVAIGILLGVFLRPLNLSTDTINYIAYPGEIFMRLLKLMILPLIIASLISGAASLNAKMSGMIMLRTIIYFLSTSLTSSVLGLVLVLLVHPGSQETKTEVGDGNTENKKVTIVQKFMDLGRNLFPDNLFQASFQSAHSDYIDGETVQLSYRSGTNTLGIMFFCLVFGIVLGSFGKRAKGAIDFFTIINEAIMKIVCGIMWVSPLGISSIICAKILSVANLALVMSQLTMFIVTVIGGVFLYQFTVLQLLYFIFVRKNPFTYWLGLFQAWLTAFSTASAAAALPITFRSLSEKNHVDPRISKFVLPIGATVNMDGTALFVTVASIFIAQLNNIDLDAGQLATVVLISTATSIAAASIPSAALVLMLIVLPSIGAPVRDVSLLWAVDWLVDRCRTTNNLLGDAYGAAIVEALSKKELREMDQQREQERRDELRDLEKNAGSTMELYPE